MATYIKKPIRVEAFLYDGELKDINGSYYIPDWAVKAYKEGTIYYEDWNAGELFIKTSEGIRHVSVGDYIIKGVRGEIYPCKPDIFKDIYDEIKPIEDLINETLVGSSKTEQRR